MKSFSWWQQVYFFIQCDKINLIYIAMTNNQRIPETFLDKRTTCSVEGEDVSFTFGSTFRCVGFRAAAGTPPTLPLWRGLLIRCRVQIWTTAGNLLSKQSWIILMSSNTNIKIRRETCWVLPLATIAAQDGARWRGQTLQGGWRQNLLGSKLRQLGKPLLKIYLWENPASPTNAHKYTVYIHSPPINNLYAEYSQR